MSENPLRWAALVQGYPVRQAFSSSAWGDGRLWFDTSNVYGLLDSSGSPTTGSSPAKLANLTQGPEPFALANATRIISAQNSRPTLRLLENSSATPPTSLAASDFAFLHNERWVGYFVFKTPSGTDRVGSRISLLDTGGFYDGFAGAYVYVETPRAPVNEPAPAPRLYVAITRGVLGTYVAYSTTYSQGSVTPDLPSGRFVVAHIRVDTTTTASDRIYIEVTSLSSSYGFTRNGSVNQFSANPANTTPPYAPRLLDCMGDTFSSSWYPEFGELILIRGWHTTAQYDSVMAYLRTKWYQ